MDNQKPIVTRKASGLKTFLIVLLAIILLVAIGYAVYYFMKNRQTSSQNLNLGKGFSKTLSPAQAKVDQTREVKKVVTAGGTVLFTQSADGTLYSLTIPPDAVVLPTEVTLAPLTEIPVANYERAEVGFGVLIGPERKGLVFPRPAYLTIKPKAEKPAVVNAGAAKFGRCNVASRGFDPEICAGERKIPFDIGIEPGKAVLGVPTGAKNITFLPTVPTEGDTYNTLIWQTGTYFADKITEKEAEALAQYTIAANSEYPHLAEAFLQVKALGGSLDAYATQIQDFKRAKKDYPRAVLQTAMLAQAVGKKDVVQERINDLKEVLSKNLGQIKMSYFPASRYVGTMNQIKESILQHKKTSGNWLKKALAYTVPFEPLTPPPAPLKSWDEVVMGDDNEAIWDGAKGAMAEQTAEDTARGVIGDRKSPCSEKLLAIEILKDLGKVSEQDKENFTGIVEECAQECKTMEECEHWGDLADWLGIDIGETLKDRFADLLRNAGDCDFVKKNLSNYGMNSCP